MIPHGAFDGSVLNGCTGVGSRLGRIMRPRWCSGGVGGFVLVHLFSRWTWAWDVLARGTGAAGR